MVDEFERKMNFSGYINTLSDTVTRMNPSVLCAGSQKDIEAADLKSIYQQSLKEWLTMLNTFIKRASYIGDEYPIESILGMNNQGSQDVKYAERKNP